VLPISDDAIMTMERFLDNLREASRLLDEISLSAERADLMVRLERMTVRALRAEEDLRLIDEAVKGAYIIPATDPVSGIQGLVDQRSILMDHLKMRDEILGECVAVLSSVAAIARVKWGNLDPGANAVLSKAESLVEKLKPYGE
jgi:hypothetical protein